MAFISAGMFDEGKEGAEGGVEDEIDDEEEEAAEEDKEGKEYADQPDIDDRNCPPHEFECWTEDCVALR